MKTAIIYGLGNQYEVFRDWIKDEISDSVKIIGVTDKEKKDVVDYPFIVREKLQMVDFDEIIITSSKYYNEISEELQNGFCIPANKIISMDDIIEQIYKKYFQTEYFDAKNGAEIGGPSKIFEKNIYTVCASCDGVNFNSDTVWWSRTDDQYGYGEKELGKVIISDATQLDCIDSDTYDFCISSNNLEHIANPLKALKEFVRITRKNGVILLLVPVKDKCFDHNRDYTTFEHIVGDYEDETMEDDLTHLDEILEKHDWAMDPGVKSCQEFKIRSGDNFHNRCLHHHVFCEDTLIKMFEYLDIQIISCFKIYRNYGILGRKR